MLEILKGFSSLVLTLQTGVSEAGKIQVKDKSYPRVLPTATEDDLYTVGTALAGLSAWPLDHIERVNREDLYMTE